MIQSMTGYGKAEQVINGKTIKAEIRSLNSKFFDLNLRMSNEFRDQEMAMRVLVNEKLGRGKVDLAVYSDKGVDAPALSINKDLAKKYFEELKSLSKELNAGKKNLFDAVLRIPDVITADRNGNSSGGDDIATVVAEAINDLTQFRMREGKELEKIIHENVSVILSLLTRVEPFEKERIELIKTRLRNQLTELVSSEEYDRNRFEQELIYYLERMDFSEEKMRLKSHCDFFLKSLDEKDSNGRKLNFISQEMGREINTLGSKANHAEIQKLVVQMKDELEKIKEQLLNVL